MPSLPDRPDLDQLRRRARELLRAARAGEPAATTRLAAIDAPSTLAGAQLVIAREHGFPSWPALKDAVERTSLSPAYRLRQVRDLRDLIAVYDTIGAQHPSHLTHRDWRFARVARRLEPDRPMMLAVEQHGRLVGGGLGARADDESTGALLFVGVAEAHRGLGLGRRLVEVIGREALALPVLELGIGGATEAERGFYRAIGFAGRHSYYYRTLTPPGRMRDHQAAAWLRERSYPMPTP